MRAWVDPSDAWDRVRGSGKAAICPHPARAFYRSALATFSHKGREEEGSMACRA
jgi:hypothetical protein